MGTLQAGRGHWTLDSFNRKIMNSKIIGQLLLISSFFVLSSPSPKLLLVETEGDEGDIHRKKINHSGKKEQDFSLISDLLEDSDLVRSLIPKNTDEFFDIAEEIVPGMKALQAPVEETWLLLQPVLLELPDVAEKVTPTLIEIRKEVQGDAEISDENFVKWGKSLVSEGRPFAKKALDNFVAAPLEDIAKKLGSSGVVSKIKEFLGEDLSGIDEAVAWLEQMGSIVHKIKTS